MPGEDPLATPRRARGSLDYENDTGDEGLVIRSAAKFSTPQQQQEEPLLNQSNNEPAPLPACPRREPSFIEQFAKTKGPPQITLLMMLVAIGLGSTIGVVPAVMTDRFARLNHGYNDTAACSDFDSTDIDKPQACYLGSTDAQNAAATSNLVSNVLTFLTSSLIGSLSDEYGRKGILILGISLSTLSPLMLFLIQLIPSMNPWWYYGFGASTGLVNWVAVALSALNDVLAQRFRAPGIGLVLAGFSLGIALAPVLAYAFNRLHLSLISYLVVVIGLASTILFVPETLPPRVAEEARQRREEEENDNGLGEMTGTGDRETFQFPVFLKKGRDFFVRPVKEMSILNRNLFFRLISSLAFFSGMVSSADQNLLVYYVEDRLGFTEKDVATILLISGIGGLLVQGLLLKPLNECVGEKMVVALCFFLGAVYNVMYGLAQNKAGIYAAVTISALSGMAFPTISAIKANNVGETEQGRIQGALYSLQALASGVGPAVLRFVQSKTIDTSLGPGFMFVFAGGLYLVAVAIACALPKELANANGNNNDGDIDDGDYLLMAEATNDESLAASESIPALDEGASILL